MKEFLLIFRGDYLNTSIGTTEDAKAITQKCMDWIGGIAAEDRLVNRGNRLENSGRVLKAHMTTDGPFCEMKEIVGGYSLIRADSLDEAEQIAKGCPIFTFTIGGSVEIREIKSMS